MKLGVFFLSFMLFPFVHDIRCLVEEVGIIFIAALHAANNKHLCFKWKEADKCQGSVCYNMIILHYYENIIHNCYFICITGK